MQVMTKRFAYVFLTCLVLTATPALVLTGCKPSAKKMAEREALLNQEIEALFTRIQALQVENKAPEALALVDKALANPAYKGQKARFFTSKIDLLLLQGQDKTARELILLSWKSDPALARPLVEKIHDRYQQTNRFMELRLWCKELFALGAALPADMRSKALNWQLASTLSMGDIDGAKAAIDDVVAALKPEEAVDMLQALIGPMIDAGQQEIASTLVRYVNDKKIDSPFYRDMYVTLSMRCILAAKDWANAAPAFDACVAQLADAPLLQLTRTVFAALQKSGQPALVEQFSQHIAFNAPVKTNAVNYASRVWVECGVAANKKLLPERLDALLAAKVSPVQVGNLFDRYFYEMVNDLDMVRSLCTLGERILAVCSDSNTINNLKVKILDGAFITENYDLAVHMLEQGIPGKDKAWHDMSLPKVKAHRALAQKKPREAVQYFRDFMNAWINSDQKEEFDPTSGIAYSREWILGRNANRIAGILDSIPDKAEADKARAEAKEYFKVALKKAETDAEAIKLLKEETKGMGL